MWWQYVYIGFIIGCEIIALTFIGLCVIDEIKTGVKKMSIRKTVKNLRKMYGKIENRMSGNKFKEQIKEVKGNLNNIREEVNELKDQYTEETNIIQQREEEEQHERQARLMSRVGPNRTISPEEYRARQQRERTPLGSLAISYDRYTRISTPIRSDFMDRLTGVQAQMMEELRKEKYEEEPKEIDIRDKLEKTKNGDIIRKLEL